MQMTLIRLLADCRFPQNIGYDQRSANRQIRFLRLPLTIKN
jgi:hypothetical protein